MRRLYYLFIALHLFFFINVSSAYRPDVADIFVTENGIAVGTDLSENQRYVVFTPQGKFAKDLIFKIKDKQIHEGFLGMSKKEEFVFVQYDNHPEDSRTSLYAFSKEHEVISSQMLSGYWSARVGGGNLFAANSEDSKNSGSKEMAIFKFDISGGDMTKFIGIPNDSREIDDWTIDEEGNVYVIAGEKDNTYFEKYLNSGKRVFREQLFEREIEEVDVILSHVDSSGRMYIIENPQHDDATLRIYTSSGGLEKSIELPGLANLVAAKNGEIYVIQNYKVVRVSPQGKVINSWTYIPPMYGETWEEKWKHEKKAAGVSAASSTDDLLMALIYSLEDSHDISEWLKERGTKIFPSVIEKLVLYPNSYLDYFVNEIQQQFPDEVTPLLTKAFENGNYDQKKHLIQFLFSTEEKNSQQVVDFLKEMQAHGSEDQETAEMMLNSLGIDTGKFDSLIEKLSNQSLTKLEKEQLYWQFHGNTTVVFNKLAPLLLDSKDSIRSEARTVLLKILRNEYYEEEEISDDIKSQVRKWTSDPDQFISNFAAVVMFGLGSSEFIDSAFQAAKNDRVLGQAFVEHFSYQSRHINEVTKRYVGEVLALAINIASPEIEKPYKEMDSEIAYLPTALVRSGSSEMRIATLEAISNPQYSSKVRASLTNAISPFLNDFTQKEIRQILTLPDSFGLNDSSFYSFMKEVGNNFSENKEIRRMLRDRIFSDLSVANSNSYSNLLTALEGLAEKEDLNILLRFLEMENVSCGGYLVHQTLGLLDEIAPLPEVEDRLIVFFAQSDYAVESAKILSQHGYPPAFEVLMLAIESDEDHGLEARHFKAYGEFAEHALISLLNSPKIAVQSRCAEILGEMESTIAYPIIRKQFDDAVQELKLPPSGVVAALMFYGDRPFQVMMNLNKKYDFLKFKENRWSYFPTRLAKSAADQLEEIIMKENDPDRARFGMWLIEYAVAHNRAQVAFERLAQEHPVEEIRKLFSDRGTTVIQLH